MGELGVPAAPRAPPAPLQVELAYGATNAPGDCPNAVEFRQSVREQLPYDALAGQARLRV